MFRAKIFHHDFPDKGGPLYNLPGMHWHSLKGDMKGFYAISVSGNWRVIYKFEGSHAILIDYLDYH